MKEGQYMYWYNNNNNNIYIYLFKEAITILGVIKIMNADTNNIRHN